MIELWVKPAGLRKGHDPENPQLTDIVGPSKLAQIASRVILQTECDNFICKDRLAGSTKEERLRARYVRVEFDPTALHQNKLKVIEEDKSDEYRLAQMRDALQNDYLSRRTI